MTMYVELDIERSNDPGCTRQVNKIDATGVSVLAPAAARYVSTAEAINLYSKEELALISQGRLELLYISPM